MSAIDECQGKVPFDSFDQAKRVLKSRRHGHKHHRHREVYHCRRCRKFHIAGRRYS